MIFSIIYTIAALINVLNIWFGPRPIIGMSAGLFFVFGSIWWAGCLRGKEAGKKKQFYNGFLLFFLITIIFLTLVYYLYQWNNLVFTLYIFLWVIAQWLFYFLNKRGAQIEKQNIFKKVAQELKKIPKLNWLIFFLYLLSVFWCLMILFQAATWEPVRTPWAVVPKYFFIIYALATLILIQILRREKSFLKILFLSGHFLLSFSIVQIVFPLGYGYDALLHLAAEKYILTWGFILPKTFYYIGQYALVCFLAKITALPLTFINSWLVPIMASCLLPATIIFTYEKIKEKIKINFLPLFFLLIPLAIFTFTTPQNLSEVLLIVCSFLILSYAWQKEVAGWLLFLLILAITLIHPIAGMAAFIAGALVLSQKIKMKKFFSTVLTMILCFLAPLAFFVLSFINPLFKLNWLMNWQLKAWGQNIFRFFPALFLNTNFVHLIKTMAYFLWQPVVMFVVILGLAFYGWKRFNLFNKMNNARPTSLVEAGELRIMNYELLKNKSTVFLLVFIVLLINSWLLFSWVDFSFLINYERGDFSWRLFQEGVYFLYPLVFLAVGLILKIIVEKIMMKSKLLKFGGSVILALIITSSLYFSYPRHDVYALNRGFNTSIYDFNSVRYLDKITPEPYVVLANQQIGAAALTEFGFRYFDHKYFFYSIPTGGELYQIYAKMAYEEKINYAVAKEAMNLVKVNVVYLYLPDYWFNLKKIKPQLEAVADETIKLENGKVWVFKFVRKQ